MSELIVARLEAYLTARNGEGGPITVHDYTPITGGYSRAMSKFYAVDTHGRRGYVMRADPPPGQSILDTDRTVEWNMLQVIANDGSLNIPEPCFFDATGADLGSPAFISERVEGDTLHVLCNAGNEESNAQYIDRLAGLIGSVHSFDTNKLPPALERPATWDTYIDSCIQSWRDAEAAHVEREPFLRVVAAWLDAHRPPPAPLSLVHGDFQGPNIIMEQSTGVFHYLDWELAHVGDPREDLGWWVLAMGSQPPNIIKENEDAFFGRYREVTGLSAEVINPETVAYFTVLASSLVFFNLIKMTSKIANGESMGSSVAYMTNAMPYMHSVWINAMKTSGHWTKD